MSGARCGPPHSGALHYRQGRCRVVNSSHRPPRRTSVKKFLASVAVALCALVGASASAVAQNYPPTVLIIVIVSGPATPGSTVTITITGCQVGETVTVAVDGVNVTVSTCTGGGGTSALRRQAAGGSATASFTAPGVGTHTIRAVGNTSGRVGTLDFTVQSAGAGTTGS